MPDAEAQVRALISRVSAQGEETGVELAIAMDQAASEIRLWLNYFEMTTEKPEGPELLRGARAAVIEAIGYCALGLGRAAVSAIRTQVDLLLGHTYFREHHREWNQIQQTGNGFRLFGDIVKYHTEIDPTFSARLVAAEKATGNPHRGVYRLLSAHVHGQSLHTLPTASDLSTIAAGVPLIRTLPALQLGLIRFNGHIC